MIKRSYILCMILILMFILISCGYPSQETLAEKDKIIKDQEDKISQLQSVIMTLEEKVKQYESDPKIQLDIAIKSQSTDELQLFISNNPTEKELIKIAEDKIKEIEVKEAEAKKEQEKALKEKGTSADNGFYYKNVIFKESQGNRMKIEGEMRNDSGQDYEAALFTVSIYSLDGSLMGTGTINIFNIAAGNTKTFSDTVNVNPNGEFKYKIQYETGF